MSEEGMVGERGRSPPDSDCSPCRKPDSGPIPHPWNHMVQQWSHVPRGWDYRSKHQMTHGNQVRGQLIQRRDWDRTPNGCELFLVHSDQPQIHRTGYLAQSFGGRFLGHLQPQTLQLRRLGVHFLSQIHSCCRPLATNQTSSPSPQPLDKPIHRRSIRSPHPNQMPEIR